MEPLTNATTVLKVYLPASLLSALVNVALHLPAVASVTLNVFSNVVPLGLTNVAVMPEAVVSITVPSLSEMEISKTVPLSPT
jgi:hypothetical protein